MSTTKSLRSIITLSLALVTLLGYGFLNAAWTPAPANPPANNVPAPINTSTIAQDKAGTLTTAKLGVIANTPTLELIDATANEKDWRLAVEGGINLVFRADRNQNSVWNDDSTHPLFLHSGDDTAGDYAVFSNQIRATEYCDKNGQNCFKASDVSPKTCQVRIDGTSMSSGGTVYSTDSQTVPIQQGTEPRIGGYFQCDTQQGSINTGYMTAQVGYDSWCWGFDCNALEGGGSRSAGGYWSQEDYLTNSNLINVLQENSIGSFTVNPGVTLTVTASAVNTGNDCDKRDMRVTATVLSCQ